MRSLIPVTASLNLDNREVLRLKEVVKLGLSLKQPGDCHGLAIAMGIAGFLVVVRVENDLNPSGRATHVGSERDRPLELIKKGRVRFQVDDMPFDSLSGGRHFFTKLSAGLPDDRERGLGEINHALRSFWQSGTA